MNQICTIKTVFPEKFGVPRQSLLADAGGEMSFPKNDFYLEAFRGIEESSHLWLIFEFHLVNAPFKALVRPPRYMNKKKLGIYATRTPHRPNRLGLSVVKFEKLEVLNHEIVLKVSGVDLVDGTPIFDIKPYVPYSDKIEAKSPFTHPYELEVKWLCEAPPEKDLISKIIALDPRPGQEKESSEEFGVMVAGYNIRFRFLLDHFEVISVLRLK